MSWPSLLRTKCLLDGMGLKLPKGVLIGSCWGHLKMKLGITIECLTQRMITTDTYYPQEN